MAADNEKVQANNEADKWHWNTHYSYNYQWQYIIFLFFHCVVGKSLGDNALHRTHEKVKLNVSEKSRDK